MCKNIFSKYILSFMVIVIISFLVLSIVTVSLVDEHILNTKKGNMETLTQSIQSVAHGIMAMSHLPLEDIVERDSGNIEEYINRNALNNDSIIFITDSDGRVIIASENANGIIPERIDPTLINNSVFEKYTYSDLGGIFDGEYINVIRPINIYPQGRVDHNSDSAGAIFVCAKNSTLVFEKVGSAVLWTVVWICLISLLAIYFVSERISRPLKAMSHAAKSFAKGKFDIRVPVRGNDEVAELATAFNNMANALEELDTNRSAFMSNVAHDLRTPMTTISGFVDGILSGTIPKDKADYYLEIVSTETKRLARLVNSLLDITRIQSGERKFNMASFDVCELARQVLISCEGRIDEKALDVRFECDEDSISVTADKDAVHQILYNLIDNAIKFSGEKGELSIKLLEKDKKVFVTVRNTGKGISKEDLPRVFDQFYKSDRSRGLDKTGLGLGLYICKTIIDQHKESIWVKSEEGAWCEFTFTLAKDKNKK